MPLPTSPVPDSACGIEGFDLDARNQAAQALPVPLPHSPQGT